MTVSPWRVSATYRGLPFRGHRYLRICIAAGLVVLLVLTAGLAGIGLPMLKLSQHPLKASSADAGQRVALKPAKSRTGAGAQSATHAAHPTGVVANDLHSVPFTGWNRYLTSAATEGLPWNPDLGGSGVDAGLYDAEYFLPSHVAVAGQTATITASPSDSLGPYAYASGVLSSYGQFAFTGGYLQITAQMPDMTGGAWPSLWLLPAPGNTDDDEVDIFEGGLTANDNANDNFSGFMHTDGKIFGQTVNTDLDIAAGTHTFGIDWVPGVSVTWYFDGEPIEQLRAGAGLRIPSKPLEVVLSLGLATAAASSWHTVETGGQTLAMRILDIEVGPNPPLTTSSG